MAIQELQRVIEVFSKKYGEPLGDGLTAAVFLAKGCAVKVYGPDIRKTEVYKEAYIMSCVEEAGIAAPRVFGVYEEEGCQVLEMQYIRGKTLLSCIMQALAAGDEAQADRYVVQMAEAQGRINLTKKSELPDYKRYAEEVIRQNRALDEEQKLRLIRLLADLPDGEQICHGDLHPNNFLVSDGGELMAIDWPEVGKGVPGCDAARTYLNLCHPAMIRNGRKKLCEVYLEAYCRAAQISREDMWKWLPVHAGMLVGYKKKDFSDVCAEYLL